MPQISKYAPGRAAAVQQWFQSVERNFDPSAKMYRELNELNQKSSTAEDIIAIAQKYPAQYQTQIYQQAAWKALSGGNPDRARQIATEFIADTVQRAQILAQIDQQLMWNNVNENKVAEARRMVRKARGVEQKVQILTQLASNLAGKGDKTQALELLNEARAYLVASPTQTSAKLSAQLQLARSYASLDMDQSFALMQGVIAQVNQLIGAAAVLDGFENRYLQEGEWMRRGYTGLSNLVNNLDQNLGFLASQNVENALTLSDQLERPEVRLMAQLDIAQALLGANSGNLPITGRAFVQLKR
jgi:hypothetical protein